MFYSVYNIEINHFPTKFPIFYGKSKENIMYFIIYATNMLYNTRTEYTPISAYTLSNNRRCHET